MARLIVMYGTPKDAEAFDRHYADIHIPLAKTIPGLRGYRVSHGPVAAPEGASAFHLIATLKFDDLAAIQAAFASPQGQAAAADVQAFATGGAQMLMFEDRKA